MQGSHGLLTCKDLGLLTAFDAILHRSEEDGVPLAEYANLERDALDIFAEDLVEPVAEQHDGYRAPSAPLLVGLAAHTELLVAVVENDLALVVRGNRNIVILEIEDVVHRPIAVLADGKADMPLRSDGDVVAIGSTILGLVVHSD